MHARLRQSRVNTCPLAPPLRPRGQSSRDDCSVPEDIEGAADVISVHRHGHGQEGLLSPGWTLHKGQCVHGTGWAQLRLARCRAFHGVPWATFCCAQQCTTACTCAAAGATSRGRGHGGGSGGGGGGGGATAECYAPDILIATHLESCCCERYIKLRDLATRIQEPCTRQPVQRSAGSCKYDAGVLNSPCSSAEEQQGRQADDAVR